MNDQTIQMIAQAIIANTKVIQSLIDALPHETKAAVAEVVNPTPTPVAAPAPVAVVAPVVVPPAPVAAPVAAPAPAMPAPPVFAAPAPAPVSTAVPFNDGRSLIDYVMGVYKQIGPAKGAGIQNVLTGLGYQNINDVKSEHYVALFQGIEALKGA
jgi:hypothetical protein